MNLTNGHAANGILKELNNENELDIKVMSYDLFSADGSYISAKRIFFAYFQAIPNISLIGNVRGWDIVKFIEKKYENQILKKHYREFGDKKIGGEYDNVVFILKIGLLIGIESNNVYILFTD